MKRKLLSVLLTAVMALSCAFPLAACNDAPTADSDDPVVTPGDDNDSPTTPGGDTPDPDENASQGLEFYLDWAGVSYYVVGIGTCTDTDLVVPYKYNGLPVEYIGDQAFQGCSTLTSVTISGNVTYIGDQAFMGCSNLTSVTLGNHVNSISGSAFDGCINLTNITIPDSVTVVSSSTIQDTAYYNNADNWENDVLYIGNHLIDARNTLSGAYKIKNGTQTIANSAFRYCSSLTSITIPDSVTSIGDSTFIECYSLTSITIPDSVTSIGRNAFMWCGNLSSVIFENTEGWTVNGEPVDVTDSAQNAVYLTDTYLWFYWTRSE